MDTGSRAVAAATGAVPSPGVRRVRRLLAEDRRGVSRRRGRTWPVFRVEPRYVLVELLPAPA
jgi:hypothetical protein